MIFKLSQSKGHQALFQPGQYGIQWLGLELLRLEKGETWDGSNQDQEAALVILSGRCAVSISYRDQNAGVSTYERQGLGSRGDVFSGLPTTIYAPRNCGIKIRAESQVEIAIGKTPATVDLPAQIVGPEDVRVNNAGIANWRRDVRMLIPPGSPISQRLIVGETINPPGNWSGFPPHKHDEQRTGENILEEFYLFKAKPVEGFGLQSCYRDETRQADFVGNDDVTVFLNGYHPTVSTPGTTLYYLWMLAGDSKAYQVTVDPTYRWLSHAEAVLREAQH